MIPIKFKSNLFKDKRGYLAEVTPKKIKTKFLYSILTVSKKNVIRGMHFDKQFDEEKLVFNLSGKVLDVTINLKKGKEFGKIYYFILKKNDILFVPKGFAHGYLCLNNNNIILYLLNKKYSKTNNKGFTWNDKNFKINWGIKKPILSLRDKHLKEYIKN